VVSADIYSLLSEWAESIGFMLPDKSFFKYLRTDFVAQMKSIFGSFVFLEENILQDHVKNTIKNFDPKRPIISLDRSYYNSVHSIQLTRKVQRNELDEWVNIGIHGRFGMPSLNSQIESLAKKVRGDVILFDDVIFEGLLMEEVILGLARADIIVSTVYAPVGIRTGVERVKSLVKEVRCEYYFDSVIDEVCERDFYPGAPFSGRTVAHTHNVGVPYIYPFGDPLKWASIPEEKANEFSIFCLNQTKRLFSEIEKVSMRSIKCGDLSRGVYSLTDPNKRFVNELERCMDTLLEKSY
jgi:hypothetical protein